RSRCHPYPDHHHPRYCRFEGAAMRSTLSVLLTIPVLAAGIALGPVAAREPVQPGAIPAHGVVGVQEDHLVPGYWLARLRTPDRVLMDKASIRKQNTALLQLDDSMHDLRILPTTLPAGMVRGWIQDLSNRPDAERWDVDGNLVPARVIAAMMENLALDAVPAVQDTRY